MFSAFTNAFLMILSLGLLLRSTWPLSRSHWSSSSIPELAFVEHFSLHTKKQHLLRGIKLQTKSSKNFNNVQYWRSCVYWSQNSNSYIWPWGCRDWEKFSSQELFPKIIVQHLPRTSWFRLYAHGRYQSLTRGRCVCYTQGSSSDGEPGILEGFPKSIRTTRSLV